MANQGDGLNLLQSTPAGGEGLTAAQRANLAIVQARLGVGEFENPNMADTPDHLAEHDLIFKRSGSDPTKR